ncbi:MAG: hypothetical protein VX766_16955 [Pseudomonadota bacterium]|nr:hypothetical protein [Pseudomonadota bacterium]
MREWHDAIGNETGVQCGGGVHEAPFAVFHQKLGDYNLDRICCECDVV